MTKVHFKTKIKRGEKFKLNGQMFKVMCVAEVDYEGRDFTVWVRRISSKK